MVTLRGDSMRQTAMLILANIVSVFVNQVMAASMEDMDQSRARSQNVQVGTRPYFLVDDMDPSSSKLP
jgi:hypothetical protein